MNFITFQSAQNDECKVDPELIQFQNDIKHFSYFQKSQDPYRLPPSFIKFQRDSKIQEYKEREQQLIWKQQQKQQTLTFKKIPVITINQLGPSLFQLIPSLSKSQSQSQRFNQNSSRQMESQNQIESKQQQEQSQTSDLVGEIDDQKQKNSTINYQHQQGSYSLHYNQNQNQSQNRKKAKKSNKYKNFANNFVNYFSNIENVREFFNVIEFSDPGSSFKKMVDNLKKKIKYQKKAQKRQHIMSMLNPENQQQRLFIKYACKKFAGQPYKKQTQNSQKMRDKQQNYEIIQEIQNMCISQK